MSIELFENDIKNNYTSNNNSNICRKYDNGFINDTTQSEREYRTIKDLSSQNDNRTNATYYVSIEDGNNLNRKSNIQIFRFKFTSEFMVELFEFSKVHQYDERKDFKEAWIQWVQENKNIIDSEIDRLTNLGYDGDILDKMFKSARYYFRKKSTEKHEPKKRRQYIGVNKDLLDAMDIHIEENIL